MPDIVAFGEVMIRLAPPHFQRLEQTRSLDLEIGGAEFNTAAGCVRLGRTATWVSRLPDNPLGKLIANRVREIGVSDTFVQYTPHDRCGLYFLEFGASPRASGIVYDRKESAIAQVQPGMFDWPTIFRGARWFHVTGITAALSAGAAAATAEALTAAKQAGLGTSIDLNYRSKLWTPQEAGRVMSGLVNGIDLLIASEGDCRDLFSIDGTDFADMAQQLIERFGVRCVAGTRRETPLVWRNKFAAVGYTAGQLYESAWYDVEIVDRLGAGDALAAGLIHGLLDGDLEKGIHYGAAIGAIQHSILGDLPWITREEVEAVLAGSGLRIRR
ncbi:MAG: sugar kinase [Bacteroidales bacterium]|nr:sugar kinase [Bacteroidales bacterium]